MRWCTTSTSTPCWPACPAAPTRWWPRPRPRASTCGGSTPTTCRWRATRPPPTRTWRRCWTRSEWRPPLRPASRPAAEIATRTSEFLTHPAFTQYRTETAMMRYLRTLADKDIALDRSMIPLGSCTMKLNAAAEMESITWPEFARQHPFAPASDTPGLRRLIADLETWLVADHRLRRGLAATQRRLAGRVRRPAGDPRLPRQPRRAAPRHLPDPVQRARHQRRVGGAGRDAGGRGGLPRQRRRRPRRPARQGQRACRPAVDADDHLPVHPRRVRARHRRDLRGRARRRRPGVRRRRQPQRAGRPGPARQVRRRRQPPEPAQDVLHPARRRRPGRRAGGGALASGAVPAGPPVRPRAARTGIRCRRRPTGRPRSCRSPGPTSG